MLATFEPQFREFICTEMTQDPAHDLNHVLRVVKAAKSLCEEEQAKLEILLPAAYLHDCFSFPKNHPDRAKSSLIAADKAIHFLQRIGYPSQYYPDIRHAIITHSYSANITPETIEAKIVQDADRLDALGAIGIARCIQVSASMNVELYDSEDPFCESREPDDRKYTIDHFYIKLFNLVDTMNTGSAKKAAQQRVQFMCDYLHQLGMEV